MTDKKPQIETGEPVDNTSKVSTVVVDPEQETKPSEYSVREKTKTRVLEALGLPKADDPDVNNLETLEEMVKDNQETIKAVQKNRRENPLSGSLN